MYTRYMLLYTDVCKIHISSVHLCLCQCMRGVSVCEKGEKGEKGMYVRYIDLSHICIQEHISCIHLCRCMCLRERGLT